MIYNDQYILIDQIIQAVVINGVIRMVKVTLKEKESCHLPTDRQERCCKVESLISIDDRGQMVLPKEIRDKARIRPGDKLAVISWEKDGEVCCISLIKVEDFTEMVKNTLGPLIKEIL